MGGGYDGNGQVVLGKRPTMDDYGGVMEFNYEEVFYGGKGQEVYLHPKEKPTWGPNWDPSLSRSLASDPYSPSTLTWIMRER